MDSYGPQARRAFRSLLRRHGISYDAFAVYMTEHGYPTSKQQVGHWCSGRDHLPMQVWPFAEALTGDHTARAWMDEFVAELRDEDATTDHASPEFRVRQLGQQAHSVVGQVLDVLGDGRMDEPEAKRLLPQLVGLQVAVKQAIDRLASMTERGAA